MTGCHTIRRRGLGEGLVAALVMSTLRSPAAANDALSIAYPFDVPTWDPTAATFVGAQALYKAVFDAPLQYSADLKLTPGLISEWQWQGTHTLEDTQKLHRKLLHASLVIPHGHTYLTELEA